MEHFEQIVSLKADGNVPFAKYKSRKTGLTVCIAEVAGPIVTGYLCLATEAHDDDGLPHTLEHLVFMGSEDYPYKGVLDLVANRCLASGTNAWTDTDHTCYTMTTAGSEGFLNLLPIYLDHILFPTLTEAAFVTEVHHINGNGEDAGVVYCEMQARENMGESLCHLHTLRALYPGHCGYKSETGGLMKNLRESTTNEKIHSYHKKFYRAENLCIIITGQCSAAEVFQVLQPMEDKIIAKGPKDEFERPWQSPVPPLPESVDQIVPYPCDEDEHGLVYIAWRGPKSSEFRDLMAMFTLMDYLTYSSVSPLRQAFVETEDPYCSQIGFSVNENFVSCLYLTFSNVPKAKLRLIKDKVVELLTNLTTGVVPFDMDRMQIVIRRRRLTILSQMECSPHDSIALNIIGDFLYGYSVDDLKSRIQHIPIVNGLAKETAEYWINLLKTYLVDGPMVATVGEPDPALMAQMAKQEKERVEKQRQDLGEEGLAEKQKILEKSMELNEKEPPPQLLSSVPVPSTDSIHFHSIERTCNYKSSSGGQSPSSSAFSSFPIHDLPFKFQLDSVQSNFVEIYVMMDTSHLSHSQRLYLPLFMQLVPESPILRGEGTPELVPYETVVAELAADTVYHDFSLGVEQSSQFSCGTFGQLATLYLKVDMERYERGVQWVRELLFSVQFDAPRISVVATRMINDVAQTRREGMPIANTLHKNMLYRSESNNWAASLFRQLIFLRKILALLESDPEQVIQALTEIRQNLTSLSNLTVHMSANVPALIQPRAPWENLLGVAQPDSSLITKPIESNFKWESQLFHSDSSLPRGAIAGIGSVESSYLIQTTKGITSYNDPDLPPLLVLLQYLTQLEGPMWRQLRGQGLAYSFSVTVETSKGLIYLILARSTHVAAAYIEATSIVMSHLAEDCHWDEELLESARSSLVFEIVEKEKSISDISLQSLLAYHKHIDMDYTRKLLHLVSSVDVEDMRRVGRQYLAPLFDPAQSLCSICCHPAKVPDLIQAFHELGRELTVISNLEESFVSALHLEDGS